MSAPTKLSYEVLAIDDALMRCPAIRAFKSISRELSGQTSPKVGKFCHEPTFRIRSMILPAASRPGSDRRQGNSNPSTQREHLDTSSCIRQRLAVTRAARAAAAMQLGCGGRRLRGKPLPRRRNNSW